MMTNSFGSRSALALVAAALSALTACAPQYSAPEQVQSSSPKVTYKYHSDQELAQANQNAAVFCAQYQSAPRTMNISNEPDGSSKTVMFECMRSPTPQFVPQVITQPAPPTYYNNNYTYTYTTDQEFADATRSAQAQCMSSGYQQVVSSMVTNPNGSRTVSFQCVSR
jgi:hypothetical protein